jgi:branched-chain amino acid transport system substrate-binding protein
MAGLMVVGTGLVGLSTAPASAASNDAPLNVGIICSCTGALSSATTVGPPAWMAWAKAQNAKGGLNGHKIQIFYKDDAGNATSGVSIVESMINDDHIQALVDDSQVDTNFATYVAQHHVPTIGGGAESDLDVSSSNYFAPGETVDEYFLADMLAAKKVGGKNIGQMYCAESVICQQGVASFKSTAKSEGVKVGYIGQISYSAPNYTAQCVAAQQAGVTVLDIADAPTVLTKVASDCLQQNYDPWQVGGDGAVSTSFLTAPGLNDKFIGYEPDEPFFAKTPAIQQMNATLKKYAASSTINSPNYNEESVENYTSALVLGKAVQLANAGTNGPITSANVYKGLYLIHNSTIDGMGPPRTYVKGQPNPIHCFFWIKIQNAKFTTPYGTTSTCASPPTTS